MVEIASRQKLARSPVSPGGVDDVTEGKSPLGNVPPGEDTDPIVEAPQVALGWEDILFLSDLDTLSALELQIGLLEGEKHHPFGTSPPYLLSLRCDCG